MNTLSWMLYFGGVVSALGGWMTGLGVIAMFGEPLRSFFSTFDEYADPHPSQMVVRWKVVAIGAAAVMLSTLIPSQNTVYAIAASEMGEKALTSATGGKAAKALDAWLDRQIAGEEEKK
jgi:hypothetical protein